MFDRSQDSAFVCVNLIKRPALLLFLRTSEVHSACVFPLALATTKAILSFLYWTNTSGQTPIGKRMRLRGQNARRWQAIYPIKLSVFPLALVHRNLATIFQTCMASILNQHFDFIESSNSCCNKQGVVTIYDILHGHIHSHH